jgi:hypothetical protein
VAGFKIGVARAPFFDHLDPDVAATIDEAIGVISGLAKGIQEVSLPTYKDLNVDSDGMMEAEDGSSPSICSTAIRRSS